jgi:hypothetical protein
MVFLLSLSHGYIHVNNIVETFYSGKYKTQKKCRLRQNVELSILLQSLVMVVTSDYNFKVLPLLKRPIFPEKLTHRTEKTRRRVIWFPDIYIIPSWAKRFTISSETAPSQWKKLL